MALLTANVTWQLSISRPLKHINFRVKKQTLKRKPFEKYNELNILSQFHSYEQIIVKPFNLMFFIWKFQNCHCHCTHDMCTLKIVLIQQEDSQKGQLFD